MRDTDRDLTSSIVVRADSGIADARRSAAASAWRWARRLAAGDADSRWSISPSTGSSRNGLRGASRSTCSSASTATTSAASATRSGRCSRGEADAACMIDGNHLAFAARGTLPAGARRASSRRRRAYDHCNFTVLDGAPAEPVGRFRELLLGDVLRRPAGAAAARPRGPEGVAAGPHQRATRSSSGGRSVRDDRRVRAAASRRDAGRPRRPRLRRGRHLLVKRALRQARPASDRVRGTAPDLDIASARLVPRARAIASSGTAYRRTGQRDHSPRCRRDRALGGRGARRRRRRARRTRRGASAARAGASPRAARSSRPARPSSISRSPTRAEVWADDAARIYAQAAAAQWDPATAIPWDAAFDLPDEVEDAVVQIMTYLIENETAALIVPSRFLAQLHPHFREVMQVLAIQAADEARHIEVFTRRALLKREELGLSTAGGQASLETLVDEPDFAIASFLLSVLGEGSFLSLLWFLERTRPIRCTRGGRAGSRRRTRRATSRSGWRTCAQHLGERAGLRDAPRRRGPAPPRRASPHRRPQRGGVRRARAAGRRLAGSPTRLRARSRRRDAAHSGHGRGPAQAAGPPRLSRMPRPRRCRRCTRATSCSGIMR